LYVQLFLTLLYNSLLRQYGVSAGKANALGL